MSRDWNAKKKMHIVNCTTEYSLSGNTLTPTEESIPKIYAWHANGIPLKNGIFQSFYRTQFLIMVFKASY